MSLKIHGCFAALLLFVLGVGLIGCDEAESVVFEAALVWPPKVGEPFPDIEFTNYDGRKIQISDFKGKVVLVEPVGMTCPACNALSGGRERGGIKSISSQRGLKSIEEYLPEYGDGITLNHEDVVLIQVLLYDLSMAAPDIEDAQVWAAHFQFDRNPSVYVVFSERDMRGEASFKMIPGVQLVDKISVVRFDSTGHRPRHNLFTQLLPAVPRLLGN